MKISDSGVRLISEFEGFRDAMYEDVAGHCTIGYGHLVHLGPIDGRAEEEPFKNGISNGAALRLLQEDIGSKAEVYVKEAVTVLLTQPQFDALCSLCFNIGGSAFMGSTLVKELNGGNYNAARGEFMRWIRAGGQRSTGLIARRGKEAALFGMIVEVAKEATA
jgi:lysozyme